MEFREFLILNELHVHKHLQSGSKYYDFIAFRGNLWLFDSETEHKTSGQEFFRNMIRIVRKDFSSPTKREKITGFFGGKDISDLPSKQFLSNDDVQNWIEENVVDMVRGYWDVSKRTIWISAYDSESPVSSSLVKKVAQSLKVRSVKYETEEMYQLPGSQGEYETSKYTFGRSKLIGDIPDTMYHGTTTFHLEGILSAGLRAGESESNFLAKGKSGIDIVHFDRIFLHDRFSPAVFHANNTSKRQGGTPAILEVKIPDKSKLAPDYDVSNWSTGKNTTKTYQHIPTQKSQFHSAKSSVTPWRATKHAGTYAYVGRIPSNHIKAVHLRLPDPNSWAGASKWRKVRIDTLKKRIKEYGIEDAMASYGIYF